MEEATWNVMIDYSPRNGEVIATAVWCSERCKGTVGSAEGGLQVKGEAKCLSFARQNVNCKVERLRECAGISIEDPGVWEQL